MEHRITLIEGDGIGPEVTGAARMCVDALGELHGFDVNWEIEPAGQSALKKFGSLLPDRTIESIRKNKIALKGPITTPIGKGFRSINVELRQRLDLFANVRPAKTFPGIKSRYKNIDIILIRENTEDLYTGIEFGKGTKYSNELIKFVKRSKSGEIRKDSAIAIKPISSFASRRIAEFAFDYAKRNRRKKITAVHKANIMKFTDGLFLKTAQSVAQKYKNIYFESMIVDNMCMQLVIKPEKYDMLLCPNLYGDILSDLCAGLVGGLGIVAGANIGKDAAIFEPVHGSAPKHAGKNEVDPIACLQAAVMMLEHIHERNAAENLQNAMEKVVKDGRKVTYDIASGKPVGTREMTNEIIKKLSS